MTNLPPAWAHLTRASVAALLEPSGSIPQALHIVPQNVTPDAALSVPMVKAARLLMAMAAERNGLVLTKGGALKRADVRPVFEQVDFPGFDRATTLALNKVINEHDAYGVMLTRIALEAAGILRKRAGVLKLTRAGKALLIPEAAPSLLAELFTAIFWRMALHDFDRNPIAFWPQHHIGVVLWSLSVTAHRWHEAQDLVPICTMLDTLMEDGLAPYLPAFALVTRALRPLTWLGLMESDESAHPPSQLREERYRKTSLFDTLLSFTVRVQGERRARH